MIKVKSKRTDDKYYPQNKDCFICKGYGCPNDEMDTFGWMDCVNYIKRKRNKMNKLILLILFLGCENVVSKDTMTTNTERLFHIEMLDERGYGMEVDGLVYTINISPNSQSIFKMKATTNSHGEERITWTTNKDFYWSNGLVTDKYLLVNPSSYTNTEGIGYSMVGFLSEMLNTDVIIYGLYYNLTDSIIVHIK